MWKLKKKKKTKLPKILPFPKIDYTSCAQRGTGCQWCSDEKCILRVMKQK